MIEDRAREGENLRAVFPVAVRLIELKEAVAHRLDTDIVLRRAFVNLGVEHAAVDEHIDHHLLDVARDGLIERDRTLLCNLDLLRLPCGRAERSRDFDFTLRRKFRPRSLFDEEVRTFVTLDFEREVRVDRLQTQISGLVVKALEIRDENKNGASPKLPKIKEKEEQQGQMSFLTTEDNEILSELKGLNLDTMTPVEALTKLYDLKAKALNG